MPEFKRRQVFLLGFGISTIVLVWYSFDLQQMDIIFQYMSDENITTINSSLFLPKSTVGKKMAVEVNAKVLMFKEEVEMIKNNKNNSELNLMKGLSEDLNNSANTFIADSCNSKKFIVFVCCYRQLCGGWGDRQKGIISTFLLALLMNRTFSIILSKPCDIARFLVPNGYNWRTCHDYVSKALHSNATYSSIKGLLKCNNIDTCNSKQIIFVSTNQIWIERIAKHNMAAQRIPWARNKTIPEVSKIVLALLFRPSAVLENAIYKFTDQIRDNRKLICSHIRIGKNPTMPNDNIRHFGVPNVSAIFSFLNTYHDAEKYVIYVATDSENIRNQAINNFKNALTIDLPIIHVDRIQKQQTQIACEGLLAVLIEQHILSRCDLLLLTRSNMGAMAAYMSRTQQSVYIFYHKTRTIFEVTLNEVQKYFEYS